MSEDIVFIQDLRVRSVIGVLTWERKEPQEIVINVTVFTDTRQAAETDDIAHCVDYDALAQQIRSLVEEAQRFTVEALAEDISRMCLSKTRIQKVRVRVEKPGAIPDAESVGVEIERKK